MPGYFHTLLSRLARIGTRGHRHAPGLPPHNLALRLVITLPITLSLAMSVPILAATFDMPPAGTTLVGQIHKVTPGEDNTLLDIARHYDLGYHEITWANPSVDPWVPDADTPIIIPTQFILPPPPWQGIVVNIPQRRLYYFFSDSEGVDKVMTLPISIAREGWSTPLGHTTVIAKYRDPAWFVPKSIREEQMREGEIDFPTYFPPGPDNPMGMLAIKIGFDGIFIHGTNRPWGVGMRTSHGCLHLYPEDALTLFPLMKPGIPVRVINNPFMVGVEAGRLLVTHYPTVAEYPTMSDPFTRAVMALEPYLVPGIAPGANGISEPFDIDWERLQNVIDANVVVPTAVHLGGVTTEQLLSEIEVQPYTQQPYGLDANNAAPPARPGTKLSSKEQNN